LTLVCVSTWAQRACPPYLTVVQRDDETEEAISNRLNVYNEQTAPLVGFYKDEGLLLSVNATSSDAVIEAIKTKIA